LTPAPKPYLAGLAPAVHGGPDYAELCALGVRPEDVLDFSVSVNPTPPPPELREVLASVDVSTYPDSDCWELRQAAAERYGVSPEQVIAGNGSSELMWLIGVAYISPGDRVLVLEPTYGEYRRIAAICGAEVVSEAWPALSGAHIPQGSGAEAGRGMPMDAVSVKRPGRRGEVRPAEDWASYLGPRGALTSADVADSGSKLVAKGTGEGRQVRAARVRGSKQPGSPWWLGGACQRARAKVAFICNPNNPTGEHVPAAALAELACEQASTLFVVDEAYADFVDGRPTLIGPTMPDNVIVLRSLTKFSGLAGLRLGLAFGAERAIAALKAVKPPWNVNSLAQAAGTWALNHPECWPDLAKMARDMEELVGGLRLLGLEPLPTSCNFFLARVGDAAEVRRKLLARGCLVRDCTSFGLPEYVRIAVRTPEENRRLVAAFAQLL